MYKRLNVRRVHLILVLMAGGPTQTGQADRVISPNGKRAAYVGTRVRDQWQTIYMAEWDKTKDVLPGDASGKLRAAGLRALELGTWIDDHDLTFQFHCGTGCIGVYRVNVETGAVSELWTGAVDYGVHWSPKRDRAIVGLHLGGLMMLYADGRRSTPISGCTIEEGHMKGIMYQFDRWFSDGERATIRLGRCEDSESETTSRIMVWDGKRFSQK